MSTCIRAFREIGANDVGLVGGKGANLGEMTRAGLPVPPGFCVVADAYREFVDASGAMETIRRLLSHLAPEDPEDVETRTEQIRAFLEAQAMPARIAQEIGARYRGLGAELGLAPQESVPVAVRSSATAEDLPTASFAGQQDTYLNVRGEDSLLAHVTRCWASLWTARAVAYRAKQGFPHEQVALAVVVQAMIQSEVSGVLFTANPVTRDREQIVVNASWGLGEAIVSGTVTPDTYVVRKSDGALVEREIGSKGRVFEYAADGGTVEREVPVEKQKAQALSDRELAELLALGLKVEAHYRAPMDIEWACEHGRCYLLQARAITTLAEEEPGPRPAPLPGEFNRKMFVEIFPDPLSPAFLSVIAPLFKSMLDFTLRTLGFAPPRDIQAIGVFYNQPYFNRRYLEAALEPLGPAARQDLVSLMVNPFGRLAHGVHVEFSPHFAGMVLRLLRFMTRFPAQLPGILARYRAAIRQVTAVQLEQTSDREIVERILGFVYGPASNLLNCNFLMIAVIGITYRMLGALLRRYFGQESEEIESRLLSGITGNVTMETNKRIWDLAQIAKRSPEVAGALRQFEGEALTRQLGQTPAGRDFLAALDGFLAEYGHREIRMDILYPTWGQDPTPLLAFLRGYLDLDASASPHRQQERLVAQREATAEMVRQRLARDALGRLVLWPVLNWVLRETYKNVRERDTMHFELTRLFPPFRGYLLTLGQRWTERGLLDRPEDVFFLALDEMLALADSPQSVRGKVAARRNEFEANKRRAPPNIIHDGEEMYGEAPALASAVEGSALRGTAGSPGRATGRARVIRGPEEFDRLQRGDILVAPLTNPVWTPLFAIAGGLVTEVGGILSHGAIVAREYGIPAVMAVSGATQILREGDETTVDGNQGVVYVGQVAPRS